MGLTISDLNRVAWRIAITRDVYEEFDDGFPHIYRQHFDTKTSLVKDDTLKSNLDRALQTHDDFKTWMSNISRKDRLDSGDYRDGQFRKKGVIDSLGRALDQATRVYGDLWGDLQGLFDKVTAYDIGRPQDKATFVSKWDDWLSGCHEALSVIVNRIEKHESEATANSLEAVAARVAANAHKCLPWEVCGRGDDKTHSELPGVGDLLYDDGHDAYVCPSTNEMSPDGPFDGAL